MEAPQYSTRIAAIASDRKRVEEQELLKTIPKGGLVDHVMDIIKTKVSGRESEEGMEERREGGRERLREGGMDELCVYFLLMDGK